MGQFSTSFAILNAFLSRNKATVITLKAILKESRACVPDPRKQIDPHCLLIKENGMGKKANSRNKGWID